MNNQYNNPMNAMLEFMNGGGDPKQLIEKQLANNPQLNQTFQQLKGMMGASKLSSKEFAMQYFKGMGINPQQVEMLAKKMGIQ